MDYTVLYIIGLCIISVVIGFEISYLMKKFNINKSQLTQGIDISKSILVFISISLKDMKFGDKETIDKSINIIEKGLEYIDSLESTLDKAEKIKKSTAYCISLCDQSGIKLTKERIYIINVVINSSYNLTESLKSKN